MEYLSNLEALHNHFEVVQPIPESLTQLDYVLHRDVGNECDQILSPEEAATIIAFKGITLGAYDNHILVIPEMGDIFPTVVAQYRLDDGTPMALNVYRMYTSNTSKMGVLTQFDINKQLNAWLGAVLDKLKEVESNE